MITAIAQTIFQLFLASAGRGGGGQAAALVGVADLVAAVAALAVEGHQAHGNKNRNDRDYHAT